MSTSRKLEAIELAKKISLAKRGEELDMVLEEMKKFEIKNDDFSPSTTTNIHTDTVGIWALNENEGMYERDEKQMSAWSYWANIHQIPVKKLKSHRVVLVGESVARGYFYDPHYTPAQTLEHTLNTFAADTEVIDLAKIDMTTKELLNTVQQAIVLNPDIIIVYAGNNFYLDMMSSKSMNYCSRNSKGFSQKIFEALENELGQSVDELTSVFMRLSEEHDIKIVFVIPEFNLADWNVPRLAKTLPNLETTQLQQWVEALNKIPEFIKAGKLDFARQSAELLIELDSTHPAGFEFLAEIDLKLFAMEKARKSLQLARDNSFRSVGRPRIFNVVRDRILRRKNRIENFHVIDLQDVFVNHLGGRIPDKSLFLDYCHLTVEGIQLSVAHIAHMVLNNIFTIDIPLEKVLQASFNDFPDQEIVSKAHFFAAIHNAHNSQGYDIVRYHCAKSMSASKKIGEFMSSFLDLVSRKAPNVVCKSFEEIMSMMDEQRYHSGFSNPRHEKLMDVILTRAIVDVLKENGADHNSKIRSLRDQEHGVRHRKVDLLESFYSKKDYDVRVGKKLPFYQAFHTSSEFYLIADSTMTLEFKITCKSRNLSEDHALTIKMNNILLTTIQINDQWQTFSFLASPKVLIDGINEIILYWPIGGERSIPFEIDLLPDFLTMIDSISYCTGEIYSFVVTDAVTQPLAVENSLAH